MTIPSKDQQDAILGMDPDAVHKVLTNLSLIETSASVTVRRLTGGASRVMYLVESIPAQREADRLGGEKFVLRLDGDSIASGHGLALEARLLEIARTAGVPAPVVHAVDEGYTALGAPFLLMEFVDGQTLPKRIQADPGLAGARAVLPTQFGRALGLLHRVPVEQVPAELREPRDEVQIWRSMMDSYGQPHPAFEVALRWLDDNRPDPVPAVLLHGDFRVGNVIVDSAGLAAVLDWELAHVGDPREDLGWLCSPSWRFGKPLPVGGIGEYPALLDAYQDASGTAVSQQELQWFEVLGTLRWGVLCIGQTMRHLRSSTRSVELAALGRRVCEIEWDLLESIR